MYEKLVLMGRRRSERNRRAGSPANSAAAKTAPVGESGRDQNLLFLDWLYPYHTSLFNGHKMCPFLQYLCVKWIMGRQDADKLAFLAFFALVATSIGFNMFNQECDPWKEIYATCTFRQLGLHPAALVTHAGNDLVTRDWTAHIISLSRAMNGLVDAGKHTRPTNICIQTAAATVG